MTLFATMPIDYSSQASRDIAYNKIARDNPAYISLLYPFLAVLLAIFPDLKIDSEISSAKYIFNGIVLLCFFLPALFYLYKQLAREISVIIVENIFFKIVGNPYILLWRRCSVKKLNEACKIRLAKIASEKYNITIVYDSDTSGQNKGFKSTIKDFVSKVREEESVRCDSIVFENNCDYGFFRNLIGGIALNIILYYILLATGAIDKLPNLYNFFHISIRVLWILFIVLLYPVWHSRIRQAERQFIKMSWL